MKSIKISFIFIITIIFISSCSNNKNKVTDKNLSNDSIIEKNELVNLISEIFIIESIINKSQSENKTSRLYSKKYYDYFFEKHKITKDKILNSIEYYSANKMNEEILDEAINKLTELEIYTNQESQDSNKTEKEFTPYWLLK